MKWGMDPIIEMRNLMKGGWWVVETPLDLAKIVRSLRGPSYKVSRLATRD
jgi:hypothetical protein